MARVSTTSRSMPDDDPARSAPLRRGLSRRALLRLIGGAAGVAALNGLLAACGGSGGGDATATKGVGAGNSTATTAGAPAATAAGGSPAPGAASPTGGGASPTTSSAVQTPPATAKGGGRLTILVSENVNDLDPQSNYTATNTAVMFGMYEMLVRLKGDSSYDYEPMLAKEWTNNADFSEWTFKLNENITFHDGTPCDANAIVNTYRRNFELGLAPKNIIARFVAKPEDITAPDATTVVFKLSSGNELFLAALASDYGNYVPSPAAIEANKTDADPWAHEWFLQNGVGTGPYKLKEVVQNDHITLERFDGYRLGWDGPHFDEIVFRIVIENATRRSLLESGDADALQYTLTPRDISELQKAGKLNVLTYVSTEVFWVQMNGVKIADPKARQGFSYAYPYDDVRAGVFEGLVEATSGPMTPIMRGYDPNGFIYTTDLDKAKTLLTEANWDFSKTLEYWLDQSNESDKAAAQLFQANLQQLGIQLDIVQKEGGTLNTLYFGSAGAEERPDFFAWNWWPDYNDGWNQIYTNFYSQSLQTEAGPNAEFYKDDRVDKDLDAVAGGVPMDVYNATMADCNNVLTQLNPGGIFQGAGKWITILQPNIKNFQPNPVYLFIYNLYDMYRA